MGRVTAEGEVKTGIAAVNCEALTKMWKGAREEKLKKRKRNELGAVRCPTMLFFRTHITLSFTDLYRHRAFTKTLGTHFILSKQLELN